MVELWNSLDGFWKTMWIIAIFTSLVFIVQTIMTFAGMDAHGDVDADFNGDMTTDDGQMPFQLFTFRNFINFFLGFSWTVIAFGSTVSNKAVLLLLGVVVGVILVTLVMLIFRWLYGMQQSGNIDVTKTAVGCKGSVYLTIPAARQGEGKVQITIQGAIREFTAMTDGDKIPTGTPIKVVEVLNEQTLLVDELQSLIV